MAKEKFEHPDSSFIDSKEYFGELAKNTEGFFNDMLSGNALFRNAISMLSDGSVTVELKKKYMLKAIDETWVNVIEESLNAVDACIRNPSKYIEEREEVLPIELSRNITNRSLRHLAQHTNYIQKIENDTITPSKILNVYREETIMTYENKFINTLINHLYTFVSRRYSVAKEKGQDEKSTLFNFSSDFNQGNLSGRLSLGIEIFEKPDSDVNNTYVLTTPLWSRVEKLFRIVSDYISSDFAKSMGKSYVNPPIMRTNAILKNKNRRQCLALWEFIESYDNAGFGLLIQEDAESVDEAYLKDVYSALALQYVMFRYNIENEFVPENRLNSEFTEIPIAPQFVTDIKKVEENEFNVFDTQYKKIVPVSQLNNRRRLSDSEKEIAAAIDLILAVLPIWDELVLEEEARKREEEERRLAEEEAARLAAEEEAKRRAEEEAARIAAEKAEALAKKKAERAKAAKIARKKRKEEALRRAAEEEARRRADEKAAIAAAKEHARILLEEEAIRLQAEEQVRLLEKQQSNKFWNRIMPSGIKRSYNKRNENKKRKSEKNNS